MKGNRGTTIRKTRPTPTRWVRTQKIERVFKTRSDLTPAIAQDARSGEVLMLAYMNRESLEKTLDTGYAHYFSRSRNKLWKKGETSSHLQRVREVWLDCDGDTILLKVDQRGPACHTGRPTCFFRSISGRGRSAASRRVARSPDLGGVLDRLYETISDRLMRRPRGSYTVELTRPNPKKGKSGLDKVLEKIGEESTEVILAAKASPRSFVVSEVSDLLYHLMVALRLRGIAPEEIAIELARRGA